MDVFTSLEVPEPCTCGIVREIHHAGTVSCELSFQPSSPSPEDGGGAGLKVPHSNHGLVFVVPSPVQQPRGLALLEQESLPSPRKSQGIQSSVSTPPLLRKLQGFEEPGLKSK